MNILSYITITFSIAFIYFLAGNLSLAISPDNNIVTIVVFSAEGIALASAILYGKRVWIAILIGQFFLAYYNGMEWQPSLGIAIVNSVEAILAVIFFRKLKLNKNLSTFRDVFWLILIILCVLQPFSALLGNFVLLTFNIIEPSDYLNSSFFWFIGNIMGQLLIAPMLLLMYTNIRKKDTYKVLIVASVSIILSYLFLEVYPIKNPLLLLALTIFFTLFLSYQKGVHYGAFATVIIAFVSLYLTHNGIGVFIEESPIDNIINLNTYFMFQILLVLLFGTLLSDMKDQAKKLKILVQKEVEKNKEQQFHMLQQNRLSLKGEMISMIAHQWKQPLNNLSLINQMLIFQYEDGKLDDKSIQEFDYDSTKQIKQMSQTISDFTNFFSPEVNTREFYLKEVVNQSLDFLRPILLRENICIHLKMKCETDILLKGYPNELGQMIINILNNAKDVLIERDIQNRKIWVNAERVKNQIHLSIEDNAGGISLNVIGKIFDPYFSTKAKNGTGLGLYMSKMIIEEHMDGQLLVSNTDHGAKFEIILSTETLC
jgi:signal transduction histidine kinase